MDGGEFLTEVPQNLQMLIRLVVRGFYTIEDTLIIDMLVRNFCMNEKDILNLLKFDEKLLRARINTLKTDKFIQSRMKMITTEDGKSAREQYYFINYKSFVNVIKYKLDHVRKKLEMEERDQTSRASFLCVYCRRSYTDLEADQLLDSTTNQLLCIICKREVQEDMSGMPRHDTRLLLTSFNEQMESLFNLLRDVENIKLDAKFSEPQPKDFSDMQKPGQLRQVNKSLDPGRTWSGESSKKTGFTVEGSIDVNINSEGADEETVLAKEKPIWLTEATSLVNTNLSNNTTESSIVQKDRKSSSTAGALGLGGNDDVLVLLQTHEKKPKKAGKHSDSDSEDSVDEKKKMPSPPPVPAYGNNAMGLDEITISDDDDSSILVNVGRRQVPINDVDSAMIASMTQKEKNDYIRQYQEWAGSMED